MHKASKIDSSKFSINLLNFAIPQIVAKEHKFICQGRCGLNCIYKIGLNLILFHRANFYIVECIFCRFQDCRRFKTQYEHSADMSISGGRMTVTLMC